MTTATDREWARARRTVELRRFDAPRGLTRQQLLKLAAACDTLARILGRGSPAALPHAERAEAVRAELRRRELAARPKVIGTASAHCPGCPAFYAQDIRRDRPDVRAAACRFCQSPLTWKERRT